MYLNFNGASLTRTLQRRAVSVSYLRGGGCRCQSW